MRRTEALLAALAFAALCVAVLTVTAQTAEPDDGAYHHSIVAITSGHMLTLSARQLYAVEAKMHDPAIGQPPGQWIEVAHNRYISEKDPGYPYLAAPFQELGIIRLAPLFYGLLACLGLFAGARRWLGCFGGATAVGLYCSSGSALSFAWRDYMPTFTDASLVAAGSGALLWSLLATDATPRRRLWFGLGGFAALELATFARYTNIVILGCAVVAVVAAAWSGAVPRRMLGWWLTTVVVFAAGVGTFDDVVYGGPLTTGYARGEVKFSLGAIGTNLRVMPRHLLESMPMLVLGVAAVACIVARAAARREHSDARRDLWVGLAVGGSWLSIWGLYSAYTWTTDLTNYPISDVRFYVPALGAIALLGAWLITRIPGTAVRAGVSVTVTASLFVLGVWSFHAMYAEFGVPLHG
ncbi:MAG TPA: hypothetical protein VGU02_00555 [Gaiellaceae bacterium]|nr:hypothetical protein [Gaiellaceae bacterium]